MFFTRIGKVLAHIVFWLSASRIALAIFFAVGTPDMENNRIAASRYLAAATTGEAINESTIWLLVAVALGVLCEIGARKDSSPE